MRLRSLTTSASPDGNPVRGKWQRRAPKLAALTLILLGGAFLLAPSAAFAKDKVPTSRTVRGVVIDEADNFIPGAMIELTDLQTKKVLDIYSQQDGRYQFTDLRFDHDYTIKATFKGTSSESRQISSIDTRWVMDVNLTIPKSNK